MVFFGFLIYRLRLKITGNKPWLIIDAQGIFDNSSDVSVRQILWTDVQEVKVTNLNNQQCIVVVVKNPEEYLSRQSGIKGKLMQGNYKRLGSPIVISVNGLNCSLPEFFQTLQYKHKEALHEHKR